MKIHIKLVRMLLLVGVVLTIINIALLQFVRNENILPRWKNGITGVDGDNPLTQMPAYPGSTLLNTHITQLRFHYAYDSLSQTNDDTEAIGRWYTQMLAERGWDLVEPPSDWSGRELNLVFHKKWNQILTLAIMPSQDQPVNKIEIEVDRKHQQEDVLYN